MKGRAVGIHLLLGCALFAIPALASGSTPVLLYGPGEPGDAAEARALAAFYLLGDDAGIAPSIRHISTAITDLDALEALGTDQVLACPGSPISVEPFRDSLDAARSLVLNMELEEAQATLQRLDALLPCLSGVLPREDLAQISFLEGVGLAYFGREAEARASFRRALVVSPILECDSRFPPATGAIFADAVKEALTAATADVDVQPLVGQGGTLWIDGDAFPPGGGHLTLAQGRHLFQRQGDDGSFDSRVVDVRAGDTLVVASGADILAAAVRGRGDDLVLVRASEELAGFAADNGLDHVHLAEIDSVDLLHRFDVAEATWSLSDLGMVDRRLRGRRLERAGQATLIAGGVLTAVGTIVAAVGHAEGQRMLEEEGSIQDPLVYAEMERQYQVARRQTAVGVVMAGAGGGVMVVGVPMLVKGRRAAGRGHIEEAKSVAAALRLAPTGVRLDVHFD